MNVLKSNLPLNTCIVECIVEYYVSPDNSSCGEEENDECDSSSSSSDGDNSCIANNDSNYCGSDDSREPQYNNKFENSNNVGGEDKKATEQCSRRIQATKVSNNQYTAKTMKADYPFHNSNNCSSTNATKIHNLDDYKENADEHQDNFHEEGDEDQEDSDGEDQDDTDDDDDGDTDDDDEDISLPGDQPPRGAGGNAGVSTPERLMGHQPATEDPGSRRETRRRLRPPLERWEAGLAAP